MKARLLYRDRDFNLQSPLPWNKEALIKDLELDTLFTAMARDDELVFKVVRTAILGGAKNSLETIRYRQDILQDCLNHPNVVRELYAIAVETAEKTKKHYLGTLARYPDRVLRWSIELTEMFLGMIGKLRKIADLHADKFVSKGWTDFFAAVRKDLSDEYVAHVEYHLVQLKFRSGVLLSARLGKGNKGTGYVLHLPAARKGTWLMRLVTARLARLFSQQPPTCYSFSLHPRDESGARVLSELRNRGISIAANALGQATDHVVSFFSMLRTELAFYVGCVNLHEQLAGKGEPHCLPLPMPAGERRLSFRGLYDVCLALHLNHRVVGNDGNADKQNLVIVTGANQGGKSTFLRSVGLAQLMMQCGAFVPAETFCSSLCDSLLTHYKREEDTSMKSGKLDEELGRMSNIIDRITPHSLILFNESFAATNEREGSEIASQIISALQERQIRMVFVTHLYEFARGVYERNTGTVLFLRADRQADGARTFKLVDGEPLRTSFGEDLYNSIFAVGPVHCGTGNAEVRADTP